MSNKNQNNIEAIYNLTPMQEGMLFHSIYNEDSTDYFEQLSVSVIGVLNTQKFKLACEKVIERHSVLRSSFVYKKLDNMLQVVQKNIELPFQEYDWSSKEIDDVEKEFNLLLESERKKGFNLSKAPLIRIQLIKVSDSEHKLVWNNHHILFDGWSFPIIFNDLLQIYYSLIEDKQIFLPPIKQFKEFIQYLEKKDKEETNNFWKEYLAGYSEKVHLPILKHTTKDVKNSYSKLSTKIDEEISSKLNKFVKDNQITINVLLQAALALLVNKYTHNHDVIFGATFSGRPADLLGADMMVGLFINTLPIRAKIDAQENISTWINNFNKSVTELKDYENSALVEIQKQSELTSKENLFDILFVFENYPIAESLSNEKSSLKFKDFNTSEQTNYPLTIVSAPGDVINIDAAFNKYLLADVDVEKFLEHYANVLKNIVQYPMNKIIDLEYLSESDRQEIIPLNYSVLALEDPKIFIKHFEKSVEQNPDKIAISFNDQNLRYAELNEMSNRYARYLTSNGIGQEDFVGIYMNKRVELIISILAILKSGAAYVPIDPEYPNERISFILEDANVRLLISENELLENVKNEKSVEIVENLNEICKQFEDSNLDTKIYENNSIYMIYTSGSTGKPKGTVLQNQSVYNFVRDYSTTFEINKESRLMQFASIGFDAAVPEIYTSLINGGTLVIPDKKIVKDLNLMSNFILDKGITMLTLPPAVLEFLPFLDSPYLQTILSAGEACTWELFEKWGKYNFYNGYGPTEASVGTHWGKYNRQVETITVPIGRPSYNIKTYVLDSNLNPVSKGLIGELFLGEKALARGYHNKPDLTANKFIPNPFSDEGGERIYSTRDLVKILPNGDLEFIGRIDNQVKIRGFRIELGEIENVINKDKYVEGSCVVVNSNDNQKIVAFMIGKDGLEIESLKASVSKELPQFMMPNHFEIIDEFPLNAHGKINRKELENFDLSNCSIDDSKSITATEELVITIVKNILSVDKINIHHNFFELGGHSLFATRLASRIRESFEIELPINKIFESRDLRELSNHIDLLKSNNGKANLLKIVKGERPDNLPLSFAQQRMWFMQKYDPQNISNNIFTSFNLIGDFNLDEFNEAVNSIVERHEILRTYYQDNSGIPRQTILDEFLYNLEFTDLTSHNSQKIDDEVGQIVKRGKSIVFDLEKLPLFNLHVIKLDVEKYMVLLTMHHIISDGWSVNLLINEIMQLYKGRIDKVNVNLPNLDVQYADFSLWEKKQLNGENLVRLLDYWETELAGIPSIIDFPLDRKRPSNQTFNGNKYDFSLSEKLTSTLNEFSMKYNFTPYMVTLTAFNILLHKYSHQNTIVVGSPIANRNKSEVENLIGFFVNTLVIRTDIEAHDLVIDVIKQVRSKTLKANLHQDLPFEFLVDKLDVERETSHSPLFQVAFVYQNENAQRLELPNITIEPINDDTDISKYDFTLYIQLRDNRFYGTFEYNTDLFDGSTIEKLSSHFNTLIEQIVQSPKKKILNLNLLPQSERKSIVEKYNSTRKEINYERCIQNAFEEVARNSNLNSAVTYSNIDAGTLFTEEVSYFELNKNANKLANYFIKKGLGHEQIVAISMERSIDLITSLMAVLKTGAAFLPIDPGYPRERINYMLEDSSSSFIITKSIYSSIFDNNETERIYLDEVKDDIENEEHENLNLNVCSNNLAYVIYTSGTTGKPKGTLLHHEGAINLSQVQKAEFKITDNSKILQFASLSFDAFVWETVMALLNGASLNLVHNEIITSSELLVNALKTLKITTITLPPSVLAVIDEKNSEILNDLKTIIVAGEKCPAQLAKRWNNHRQFVNAYGPTETTVCASMFHYNEDCKLSPPIGKPISNFRLYILDKYLNPVPDGVIGELYISGISLARGYHNQPDLTSNKFLPDPFTMTPGTRMYKSGDLVKRLKSGDIDFVGRVDNQVKLRGFRIELTEIESVLATYPNVAESIVMVREDNPSNQQLVAYVVPKNDAEIANNDVKAFLRTKLPDYMIPSHYVILEELPLTPSKKIDYNLLPKPDNLHKSLTSEYVEPTTHEEITIANIGKELLGIDKMGIYDNFFELGGHSLLATQFVSKIKDQLNKDISLKLLFENPTIHDLVSKIETLKELTSSDENIIEKQDRGEENLLDLLSEIENMTDEEAKALLENEDGALS